MIVTCQGEQQHALDEVLRVFLSTPLGPGWADISAPLIAASVKVPTCPSMAVSNLAMLYILCRTHHA